MGGGFRFCWTTGLSQVANQLIGPVLREAASPEHDRFFRALDADVARLGLPVIVLPPHCGTIVITPVPAPLQPTLTERRSRCFAETADCTSPESHEKFRSGAYG